MSAKQPLKGLKVLDFSGLLPGPYASMLLADMGAEVLRIESPTRPDLLKLVPPFVGRGLHKVSAAHATINRNKKSLALDLKQAPAGEIIKRLLADYDIVLEQFRPGVMARLGLDYTQLKAVQPKLIYCSITGFGQTGPLKDRAGHDINYLALSGLASYSGRADTGPVLSATQIADLAGGSHHAVMAILAAVIERSHSGAGQYLDISMSDAALALNTMFSANHLADANVPDYGSELLNGAGLYDYFCCADGRYMAVGSLEPQFAVGLLQALGLGKQQRLLSDMSAAGQAKLKAALAERFSQHSQAHWQAVFARLDVCVEPVLNLSEACEHPHFQARDMFTEAQLADGEYLTQLNSALPFKADAKPQAGGRLGADTEVCLQALGYSEQEISELRARGCIA